MATASTLGHKILKIPETNMVIQWSLWTSPTCPTCSLKPCGFRPPEVVAQPRHSPPDPGQDWDPQSENCGIHRCSCRSWLNIHVPIWCCLEMCEKNHHVSSFFMVQITQAIVWLGNSRWLPLASHSIVTIVTVNSPGSLAPSQLLNSKPGWWLGHPSPSEKYELVNWDD